jgi:hypothetical protein
VFAIRCDHERMRLLWWSSYMSLLSVDVGVATAWRIGNYDAVA